MPLGQQYCRQLRKQFSGLHANFPPNRPLALGDYGVIRDDVFQRLGSIRQLGIQFDAIDGQAQSTFQFKSTGSVDVTFVAKGDILLGGIPAVRAALEVKFSRPDAVFFNAAGCNITQIDNVTAVGQALTTLLNQGRWETDYYVVTNLVKAAQTTVLASADRNAEVKLEAKSDDLPQIDMADASLDLRIKSTRSTALEIVTAHEQTPLMQLSRMRGLFRSVFRPEAVAAAQPSAPFSFGPDADPALDLPEDEVPQAGRVDAGPVLHLTEAAPLAEMHVEATVSDFEVSRAINAYIPLLEGTYDLAHQRPVRLPPGYVSLGEIRVDIAEMVAESAVLLEPAVQEAVSNDARAIAEAAPGDPSAFGFLVREEATGAVLVCIRGTQTPREWLANFTAVPNPLTDVAGFGFVHLGFERMYRSVKRSIHQVLSALPSNTRITCLGHSLGGAMTTLAAIDIRFNLGKSNVDVATFGCPRVGKLDFRERFNREFARCYRVTNQFDIVPHVPSLFTGWAHVGDEIEVDGNVDDPHSLNAYLKGLHNIGVVREAGASAAVVETAAGAAPLSMRTQ